MSFGIPEIDGHISNDNIANAPHSGLNSDRDEKESEYQKPGIQTWTWTDHQRKCQYVCVIIPIIAGSKDITFSISEDGLKVLIHFTCPKPTFRPAELFEDQITSGEMNENHPRIHALVTHLLAEGVTPNSKSRGMIQVKLPAKVQRENNTWTKRAINKQDGSKVIFLELKCYQDEPYINDADFSIKFD